MLILLNIMIIQKHLITNGIIIRIIIFLITFGVQLSFLDPCEKVNNQKFRRWINKYIPSRGRWCHDGIYKCEGRGKRNCYEVEHIVDRKGREFTDCLDCKDIVANLVMAYGQWNGEIGQFTRKKYASVVNEKTTIYGETIMSTVHQKIQDCINRNNNQYKKSNSNLTFDYTYCDSDLACNCDSDYTEYECFDDPDNKNNYVYFIIIGILAAMVIGIGATVAIYYYKKTYHPVQVVPDNEL